MIDGCFVLFFVPDMSAGGGATLDNIVKAASFVLFIRTIVNTVLTISTNKAIICDSQSLVSAWFFD
jgi:hypothetical protein